MIICLNNVSPPRLPATIGIRAGKTFPILMEYDLAPSDRNPIVTKIESSWSNCIPVMVMNRGGEEKSNFVK
jgi:hypothetical protein